MQSAHRSRLTQPRRSREARPRPARAPIPRAGSLPETLLRATALIDARAGLELTIDDLADAVGVSPRALQLTFRRHLNVTPMGYARRVRIAHAHDELAAAGPGAGASVTRIALDWGFANPSRFASYYRAAYGRAPHETLRG
jgi:transcriptional regulator GlxA family with amidase domain